jgi:site-specific DNA-methyltransferase (adenine-specific)
MIIQGDAYREILKIKSSSIDLILTDPPYNISRDSNFHRYTNRASDLFKTKYKNISNDFGDWDRDTIDIEMLFAEYNRVLRKGGTLIIFYDVWKSTDIKEAATKFKFKQPRVGMWVKNNPVPINSARNYLSNSIEFFFTFVKGGKSTFNSKYDNGIYNYPICSGGERYDHPTQKPLNLFIDLINKHSNEGDIVLDNFAGTGTTGHACINSNRNYILIEREDKYIEIIKNRLRID